jgi:hypothetical protein
MKNMHTFACPVFALQNALASENTLPRLSTRAHLGLNLGPSPIHARNVYLVLNLMTGCVSPQYHCRFDNFFKTTKHGGPDVSNTICWQKLAGLNHADCILLDPMAPAPATPMFHENSSVSMNPPNASNGFSLSQIDFGSIDDDGSVTSKTTPHVETLSATPPSSTRAARTSLPSQASEGGTSANPYMSAGTSQCGRVCTMSKKMADSANQQGFFGDKGMHYMANYSTIKDTPEDLFHDQHLELQEQMHHPIVFHAEMMGNIMYFQQALNQPDAEQFVHAVVKEVNGHVENNHWALVTCNTVPDDAQIVPSVWSMQRKRDLTTNEVKSHKARLNLHGGKQVFGMNYFETYAPVVTWFAIRLMTIFGIIFSWSLFQVDFVMAYPQAPVENDIYMELPQGIHTATGNSKDHVLKLLKNIYGQKQAGQVWNSYLVDKLTSLVLI